MSSFRRTDRLSCGVHDVDLPSHSRLLRSAGRRMRCPPRSRRHAPGVPRSTSHRRHSRRHRPFGWQGGVLESPHTLMAPVRLVLLGSFEARLDSGSVVSFSRKKAEALLAYLALHTGQMQARDKLAALLWGDASDERAR